MKKAPPPRGAVLSYILQYFWHIRIIPRISISEVKTKKEV